MKNELKHFKKFDTVLYKVAMETKISPLQKPDDPLRQDNSEKSYFIDLIESIINQQLSEKAETTIFNRFKKLFSKEEITPKKLLKIHDEKIREAGISFSKINYIKGIAKKIVNKELNLHELEELSDEDVIEELIKIKGIGIWTAEMFLIFSLLRPNIFSVSDVGLQNAMIKLYKLNSKPNNKKLLKISDKWSPYKSTASRILWKTLDSK